MASKLDHIVILLPVSSTPEQLLHHAEPFKNNFALSPGGFHTDKQTQNVLVSLPDGVYLELIAFTSKSHNPDHPWAQRHPTNIIDFAFLGRPEHGKEAYQEGRPGGRGECKWVVTMPKQEWGVGTLPFWCGDVTPRKLRVPKPETHPSGVTAVKKITILVGSKKQLERVTRMYQAVVGGQELKVGTPSGKDVTIEVRTPATKEEEVALADNGGGIYEIEFDAGVVISNSSL
jgi:hypothetical protein